MSLATTGAPVVRPCDVHVVPSTVSNRVAGIRLHEALAEFTRGPPIRVQSVELVALRACWPWGADPRRGKGCYDTGTR